MTSTTIARIAPDLTGLVVPLDSVTPHPRNARHGDIGAISQSLERFSQVKPIVVQASTRHILAGNHLWKAAKALGWTEIAASIVDVDDATALALMVADNRTQELGSYDDAALAALLTELAASGNLDATGYDGDDVDALLRDLAGPPAMLTDPDAVPEAPDEPVTKPGDLWLLGRHRLLCGDSTVMADVERLWGGEHAEMVWTDPPYGVAVGDKNKWLNSIAPSNRVEENLVNDTLDDTALRQLIYDAFSRAATVCLPGGAWYVAAPPGPLHQTFGAVLKGLGIWRQTLIWVKNNATFSPIGVSYHWAHEPIFYGWLPTGAHRYHGDRTQTTVWEIDRPVASPEHPTMKPVALVARALEHSSLPNQIVYDPFLGSGTTIIAAEQLGRACYGMEISPAYVDVCVQRYQEFTGQQAVRS